MKKSNLILGVLSSVLLLAACNGNTPADAPSGQNTSAAKSSAPAATGKIKEIALKTGARTTLAVTDRISTMVLFEIKANKGETLKSADKRVTVSSSDPEVLKVENTGTVTATYLEALKPGNVKLTVQSKAEEDKKLEIDMVVRDSVFDRQALDGFFDNSWDNVDMEHEVDEENPYIKTIAEEGVNHQFYFRDSYVPSCYVESEFTFFSEKDGAAHLPKVGFVFTSNEVNDKDKPSVAFIYFDTDCSGGKTTFYNVGYNEMVNNIWGWDAGVTQETAKNVGLYRDETGVAIGQSFKMGVLREGYNYHIYFNDVYVKSVQSNKEGFSTDATLSQSCAMTCGLFDFKAEIKYANYHFYTDATTLAAKLPATPDFID